MTESVSSARKKVTRTAAASGAVLTLGAALVAQAPPAGAAPFTVTNDDDDGAGSLRVAIESANAAAGADTITFAPGLGTITVASDIEITDELTITGPATVSGGNSSQIFQISYADEVTITGLTLIDGEAAAGGAIDVVDTTFHLVSSTISGSDATDGPGGALRVGNESEGMPVYIIDSTISDNTATSDGGGVYIHLDDSAKSGVPITVSGSTFAGNESGRDGGGLATIDSYLVSIDTTTFSGNTASGRGGGAELRAEGGSLTITSSTISGNTAEGGEERDGGGGGLRIYGFDYLEIAHTTVAGGNSARYAGGVWIESVDDGLIDHTVIGGNTAEDDFPDLGLYDNDTVFVANSLITADSDVGPNDFDDAGGNVLGEDPGLEALADNGGPNQTMAVTEASAAFNAGDPGFGPPPEADQRGLPRVQFEVIDIGAYEAQPDAPEAPEEPRGEEEPPAAQPADAAPNFTG